MRGATSHPQLGRGLDHATEVYSGTVAAPYRRPHSGQVMRGVHRPTQIGWTTAGGGEVVLARPGSSNHHRSPFVQPPLDGREFEDVAGATAEALYVADSLLGGAERINSERIKGPQLHIAAVAQSPAAEGLLTPRTHALDKVSAGMVLSSDELMLLRQANTGARVPPSTDVRRTRFEQQQVSQMQQAASSSKSHPNLTGMRPLTPAQRRAFGSDENGASLTGHAAAHGARQQPPPPLGGAYGHGGGSRAVSPVDHQKVESLFDATDKDRQALIQTIGDSARVRAPEWPGPPPLARTSRTCSHLSHAPLIRTSRTRIAPLDVSVSDRRADGGAAPAAALHGRRLLALGSPQRPLIPTAPSDAHSGAPPSITGAG